MKIKYYKYPFLTENHFNLLFICFLFMISCIFESAFKIISNEKNLLSLHFSLIFFSKDIKGDKSDLRNRVRLRK